MARRPNKSIQEILGQSNSEFISFDVDDNNEALLRSQLNLRAAHSSSMVDGTRLDQVCLREFM